MEKEEEGIALQEIESVDESKESLIHQNQEVQQKSEYLQNLRQVLLAFLPLGFTAFGGPQVISDE